MGAIFGEMSQLFWRFDFSGDGKLGEPEATKLMLCMMRSYRDATLPPVSGNIVLGASIPYKSLQEEFTMGKKLGEGAQGTVFLCTRNGLASSLPLASSWLTGKSNQMVLKMFDKSNPAAPVEDITREFALLTEVKHPLIAHVFEIFQDAANIYVVQEPYFGGDLSTAVQKAAEKGVRVDERWLMRVVQQILQGVLFLHSRGVMHCDLKEPNVMLASECDWQRPQIVVIDFGLANKFAAHSRPGGTPGYMPPEVWEFGLWTPRGDVFSIGVLLCSMRTGVQPFTQGCKSLEEIEDRTKNIVPEMEHGSSELKSLVYCMIDRNFRNRPMIETILKDPWFSMAEDVDQNLDASVLASLTRRQEKSGLRKALLADLASRENLAQMKELNMLFLELDVNCDGSVSAEDVHKSLEGKWPRARIEELVQALLGGNDKEVSYEEFMGQLIAAKEPVENELLWRVFTEVDRQKKGYLDQDDISAVLARPAVARVLGDRDPAELMKQMSRRSTRRVTFGEFKIALQDNGQTSHFDGRSFTFQSLRGPVFGPRIPKWTVGQSAEYFSYVHGGWIACEITAVDAASGAVQVDFKGQYWLRGLEMFTRLRRPHTNAWLNWFHWTCAGARSTCGRG